MASGQHEKNKLIALRPLRLRARSSACNYEYNFGAFDPDFGGGFVPQSPTQTIAAELRRAVGSPGFTGRFGGWNSLESRDFNQQRLKAFMKVRF